MPRFGGRGRSGDGNGRFSGRKSDEGSSRGLGRRSFSRNGRNGRKGKSSGFTAVGSVTPTKSMSDRDVKDLRQSDLRMKWKVYLPKGVDSITLDHEQEVLIHLGNYHENAPDYVIGTVSLMPEND